MLTISQTRALLNDPQLSDVEVEQIRDGFRQLAELIFDKWFAETNAKPQTSPAGPRCVDSPISADDN